MKYTEKGKTKTKQVWKTINTTYEVGNNYNEFSDAYFNLSIEKRGQLFIAEIVKLNDKGSQAWKRTYKWKDSNNKFATKLARHRNLHGQNGYSRRF